MLDMARPKRTENEILIDRVAVTDMLLRNMSLRQIAEELNRRNEGRYELTFQQVHYDVKKLQQEWYQEAQENIEQGIVREIKKLDKIEAECWDAWEKSKKGKTSTIMEGNLVDNEGKIIPGSVMNRKIDSSTGEVKYLEMIERCIVRRSELLGVIFPKKESGGLDNVIDNALMNMEKKQIEEEISRLCQKPKLLGLEP